jgi:exosortase
MDATVAQPLYNTTDGDTARSRAARARGSRLTGTAHLVAVTALITGVIAIALPTMFFVARESWSTEQGSHGPIVLFTGLWLLWRQWPSARLVASQPRGLQVAVLLTLALSLYTFARITHIVEIEGYAMYISLLVVLYSIVGQQALRRLWFPLFYLAFIFPPPESLIAAVTLPLKIELSKAAVSLLHAFGYPIGGEGVKIYIGQYELLVAAACSGLNSIISLTAISLFYIYIRHQAEWRYAAVLGSLIVPVALLANFVRVLILILVTYYFGESAAQGFLHNTAGVIMFTVALLAIFLADLAIRPWWLRISRTRLDRSWNG